VVEEVQNQGGEVMELEKMLIESLNEAQKVANELKELRKIPIEILLQPMTI
jgi:hypothetical protein